MIDKFTSPLKRLGNAIKKASSNMSKFGKKMKDIGKGLSLKLTTPLVALGALSIKSSMDFNKGMANIATLIPGNIEKVNNLKEGVRDLAIDTGKSTGDIAGGLYQVISAFGDTSDKMEILEINAKAAAAGLATTTDAINLTSAVTKGYGDISAKAQKQAADLAFTTVKLGQTTFPELAASIGKVTPVSAKLGVSQKELFASFATLTGVTGGAAEVSTQLSAILTGVLKPSSLMKKALKYLGYESGAAMIKSEGLVGTIQTLFDLAKGSEETFAELLGGRKEGLIASFALAGKQSEDFKYKLGEMGKAGGAMNEAFKEQTQGVNKLGHQWNQFMTRLEIGRQLIGEELAPILMEIVDKYLVPLLNVFKDLSPSGKKWVVIIGIIAGAIGPLLIMLGFLAQAIGLVTAVASPWLLIAAAIIAAIAVQVYAGYWLIKNWDKVKTWFTEFWQMMKDKITEYIDLLPKLLSKVKDMGKGFARIFLPKSLEAKLGVGKEPVFGAKSQADVNIKLIAESGTEARVEQVKKTKGDINLNLATAGYVGNTM